VDNITVLVIDADEANRNFLGQLLQKKNYRVKQAGSGGEGLRMIEEAPPAMVIFDLGLPDMESIKFIECLQQSPHMADIPCVVLSSHSNPEEMHACLKAGCAEYYLKSGMVMMTLVDSIPRLLVDGKRLHKTRGKGFLLVFLSAKGGIGTSSLCANIGMNMAAHSNRSTVAVVDMVLPMGAIAPLVGASEYGLNLVTVADQSIDQIDPNSRKNGCAPHWLFHLLPKCPDRDGHQPADMSYSKIVESLRKAMIMCWWIWGVLFQRLVYQSFAKQSSRLNIEHRP
jgi:CheY-like chemotaxis protein